MTLRTVPQVANFVYPLATVAAAICVWSLLVQSGLVPEAILPGPIAVLNAAVVESANGRLQIDIIHSLLRLTAGFVVGGLVGVSLGVVVGWNRIAASTLLPVIEVLRPIPPLAWIPLALIWFGIGEASKVFLIALTVFFPVLIATYKGVCQLDSTLMRAAQSLDVPTSRLLYAVLLPATLPDIVTGLRLGWTLGTTILVGAEMIAARSGLGSMIMNGMTTGRFEIIILGILVLGMISVCADAAFVRLSRTKVLRWHAGLDKARI